MGISGLLPLLKSIQRPTDLRKFAGETLAVDAYGWLHRGAVACALELAQGKPTRKYVDFAMRNVRMMKHFGTTPFLVFDGDFLPSKSLTEASRAKRRDESKQAGMELLKAGKPAQAYLEFQKAIDVTPEMARNLIEELKKIGIPYIVAPYEADAQMVFLERHGYVSGIVSEDSDLLVFGARRLITKLDRHGQCVEVNRREFCAVREISLTGWTDVEFRQMAIFSGCDYLDGIPNVGLKTAYRLLRKHKTPEKVIRSLQFEGKHRISENYLPLFKQAELTFVHQRVFCPDKQELVLLTPAPDGLDVEEMAFIGAKVEPELARAIALGNVNPITKEIITVDLPSAESVYPPKAASGVMPAKPLGKPIDEYFKGRRIPMGEMDANCFAVDAQQVAALTQNGLTPRVFPLPRPYLPTTTAANSDPSRRHSAPHTLRRRTEPIANLIGLGTPFSAATGSNRRRTTGPTDRSPTTRSSDEAGLATAATLTRPPKKARLCGAVDDGPASHSDDNDEDPSLPILQASKFFPTSSSSTKTRSSRRSSRPVPMSDDSLDDALLALPDFGCWSSSGLNKPRRPMDVFVDESPKKPETALEDEEKGEDGVVDVVRSTPIKSRARPVANDDQQDDVEVPLSSPIQPVEKELGEGQQQRRRSSLRSSLENFAYTPSSTDPSPGGTKVAFGLPTPASSVVGVATAPTGWSETPRLTPLQRIGANALRRAGRSTNSPISSVTAATTPPVSETTKAGKRRSHARRSLPLAPPINPTFIPLPKVDLQELEALSRPLGGSEDLIIPESDGENDPPCDSPKAGDGGSRGGLDLTRFLYG